MTPQEAKDHFGTQFALAKALGIEPPSVSEWFKNGAIPLGRQYQIELATAGRLKADEPANRAAA